MRVFAAIVCACALAALVGTVWAVEEPSTLYVMVSVAKESDPKTPYANAVVTIDLATQTASVGDFFTTFNGTGLACGGGSATQALVCGFTQDPSGPGPANVGILDMTTGKVVASAQAEIMFDAGMKIPGKDNSFAATVFDDGKAQSFIHILTFNPDGTLTQEKTGCELDFVFDDAYAISNDGKTLYNYNGGAGLYACDLASGTSTLTQTPMINNYFHAIASPTGDVYWVYQDFGTNSTTATTQIGNVETSDVTSLGSWVEPHNGFFAIAYSTDDGVYPSDPTSVLGAAYYTPMDFSTSGSIAIFSAATGKTLVSIDLNDVAPSGVSFSSGSAMVFA